MSENIVSSVIRLRRDNDYNYAKVKDTFIPANGEPVLVDTARDGLRVKVGNGVKTYDQLDYADGLFIKGYYYNGKFYADQQHTTELASVINRLYVNNVDSKVYYYNSTEYLLVNGTPTASSTTAGIMMLYDTTGQNTNGTMTQKAITDELDTKFEVDINTSEEMIIFSNNL